MRNRSFFIILSVLSVSATLPHAHATKLTLLHAETARAWDLLNLASNDNRTFNDISRALVTQLGQSDETFSVARFQFRSGTTPLHFEVEQNAYIVAHNPVVPELEGSNSLLFNFGVELSPLIDLSLGVGKESYIHGVSSNFIGRPFSTPNTLFQAGARFQYEFKEALSDEQSLAVHLQTRHQFFHTTIPVAWNGSDLQNLSFHRYQLQVQDQITVGNFEFGPEILFGQQAVPELELPLLWDYLHRLDFFPEFQTLIGGGIFASLSTDSKQTWKLFSGFYGGYFGGGLSFETERVQIRLSDFGLETSSIYQGLGERFWQFQMVLSF